MTDPALAHLLVTGGAGYVGAVLVPRLLDRGYAVRALDLYLYGRAPLDAVRGHPRLEEVHADVRDETAMQQVLSGIDAVIHLACISNDPSCELDPALTRSVNFEAFEPMLRLAREAGVQRFVFASSSSIYGISAAPRVTEDHPMQPLTLYNQYKHACEEVLFRYQSPGFTTVAVRPATICGRSPRQRLDLTVNILTAHAVERGVITVYGGTQRRPNLHMRDMVTVYELMLEAPAARIAGQAFNVGYENATVADIAARVQRVIEAQTPGCRPIRIETTSSNDARSYHICADKIRQQLGVAPTATIDDAVRELAAALRAGEIPDALSAPRYYNVEQMKQVGLR